MVTDDRAKPEPLGYAGRARTMIATDVSV